MQVRPYIIFGKKDISAISTAIENVLSLWWEKWFASGEATADVTAVENAFESHFNQTESDENGLMLDCRTNNNEACSIFYTEQLLQQLVYRATGNHIPGVSHRWHRHSVEAKLARKILRDLAMMFLEPMANKEIATELLSCDELKFSSQSVSRPVKGYGDIVITIRVQENSFYMMLPFPAVCRLSSFNRPEAPRSALSPRRENIGQGKLKVQVTAGEAELQLSDLVGLARGQVVRLNLKPGQAFSLESADTHVKICDAYLGQRQGNKAIQLVS